MNEEPWALLSGSEEINAQRKVRHGNSIDDWKKKEGLERCHQYYGGITISNTTSTGKDGANPFLGDSHCIDWLDLEQQQGPDVKM